MLNKYKLSSNCFQKALSLNFKKLFSSFNNSNIALKKKSIFDQAGCNPYHIYPWRYSKNKTQEALIHPNYEVKAPKSTAITETGKNLMKILEAEELRKIKERNTNIIRDEISVGDTIEVDYLMSITSQKINKYKGVVLEIKRPNSLSYSFKFLTIVGGTNILIEYPFYSPLLKNVKVLSKGSFLHKRKIFNIRNITTMSYRLQDMLKGGKSIRSNKKERKRIIKLEEQKGPIILDD